MIFISFSAEMVAETRKRFPGHKSLWIVEFEPDEKSEAGPPSLEMILQTLSSLRANGLDAQAHPVVDATFAAAVRGAGLELHLWSEADVSQLLPFAGLPVGSITCNFPDAMKSALARRPRAPR